MDLQPYVDSVRHELDAAAATGGPDAQALAKRLSAALESSIRLALLEALSEAAEQITRDLAPASVEVRLRGRDPEFKVDTFEAAPEARVVAATDADDDGGTWRVSLRLPEHLRGPVDAAAKSEGISVNAWLVRAVAGALGGTRRSRSDKHVSGWVR